MAGAVIVLLRAKIDSTDAFYSLFCHCLSTKRREYLYYDYKLAEESEDVEWNKSNSELSKGELSLSQLDNIRRMPRREIQRQMAFIV